MACATTAPTGAIGEYADIFSRKLSNKQDHKPGSSGGLLIIYLVVAVCGRAGACSVGFENVQVIQDVGQSRDQESARCG